MNKIKALLNDKGLLLIDMPDAERLDLHISDAFQQISIEYMNYLSRESVRNMTSKLSFDTLKVIQSKNRIDMVTEADLFVLAKKIDGTGAERVMDDIDEWRLKKYTGQCAEMECDIKKVIHEKLDCTDNMIVWGVGTCTQKPIGSGLDVSKMLFFGLEMGYISQAKAGGLRNL